MKESSICRMWAIITEVEGMSAENEMRKSCGNALAYAEDSFLIKADELRKLADDMDEEERNRELLATECGGTAHNERWE